MTRTTARTAFYTGSFDPVTYGHADVIAGALRLCDRLVLAIGVHPGKAPLLEAGRRAALLHEVAGPL
ncbi:adenylyltransferase/cytidyltransferase family protein, partial [Bosea sp. (in: a-proteobacteria)]|uniref:adenylyltransferase/cytidyltransferase family protein n=1 Tax=Bosea sp. (in: a-proteobacteria) TaxID=1871050 RepID=UPI002734157E